MKNDIVLKLQNLLLKEELSEPETLYVLAQIRKLSEYLLNKESEQYSSLLFYCDWALHAKLNRSPVKRVLQDLANNWVPGYGPNGKNEFFGFITFRNELEFFLKTFNLPLDITTDQDCWFKFRKNLIQILIDTPLERNDTKIIKFSLLKKSTDQNLIMNDCIYPYQVVFDNGKTEEWNVMLADWGPKKKAQVVVENTLFLKKYLDKVKYRREIINRKRSSNSDDSLFKKSP